MKTLLKAPQTKEYVDLTLSFENDKQEDVPGPPVRYYFQFCLAQITIDTGIYGYVDCITFSFVCYQYTRTCTINKSYLLSQQTANQKKLSEKTKIEFNNIKKGHQNEQSIALRLVYYTHTHTHIKCTIIYYVSSEL